MSACGESLLSVSLQRGAQAVVLGLCAASIPRLAHCPATTLRGPPSNVSGGEGERACTMTPWSACLQRLRATDRCEAAESVTDRKSTRLNSSHAD